jgi:hypothetical protein
VALLISSAPLLPCSHNSADTAPIFPVQLAAFFLPIIFLGTASG